MSISRFAPPALLVAFAAVAAAAASGSEAVQDLRLIPFPKNLTLETGRFSFSRSLTFEISVEGSLWLAGPLGIELRRARLRGMQARRLDSAVPAFRIAVGPGSLVLPELPTVNRSESYALHVGPDEIVCAAAEPAGLFYGFQTLCQLIRANHEGDAIPCLNIRDWPSLRWRSFQDDMTRGPSSTLATLKSEVDLGAYLKLNLMTYYMEYQFAFRKHPKIGPPNGSLTAEELRALVDYAKPLQTDILGNQQSFGHFGHILKHPDYARLRETADVLTPAAEETYKFLDDLYSEVCPVLPFPWFNVCCDETDGLGTGPSRELAASIGVGGVYVRHIRRVHDLLRDKHNKRMMMWGDIILQHPDKLAEVPKDTIMLTWGYDARASFEDQIIPFAKSGFEFFVCPGVSDWSRILPDFGVAITNIHNFVRDGTRHGAIGMINTDWQDDGEGLKGVKWHADAWAAECAWNASSTRIEDFNRRAGAVLFGERGNEFGQAIELLTRTHRLQGMKGMFNSRFWEKDLVAARSAPTAIVSTASNLLTVVRPALRHLENCSRQATRNERVLDSFVFGTRRMELIGQRMLDGVEAARLYENVRAGTGDLSRLNQVVQLTRKNRNAHELLGRQFAALWLSESKPYALDWTMARYTNVVEDYDGLLRKLEDARLAAAAGRPLPAADELGLAAPRPLFRRVRPVETSPERLAPDLPWAESSATHRLGLRLGAGAAERFDLPVEVELTLPLDLGAKPARAFLLSTNQAPLELLAQLDTLDSQGKSRLVLMIPGPLPRGTLFPIHLYLGLSHAPSPLPGAVGTTPALRGMHWLENNHVRLLLGPEGGHIYRWEIKAATNRDLTMPGESDWAGFSDMAPYRGFSYQLNCRARGPAMVEFECDDPFGHTKILRLYGGTSWMEVLLNEPTSIYWDFDNPKNFAADGPTPGQWLFSDGRSGPVGREAEGVPAQVKAANTQWGIKHNGELALGLVTPETSALHVIAPGAGAGGVGIEGSPPARHFVTLAGALTAPAAETMERLRSTLDLKQQPEVRVHAIQAR